MSLLVTGGAGFIGSNFVHTWLAGSDELIVNVDKLTYAGNLGNLQSLADDKRHVFVQGDIGDRARVERLLNEHRPRAVGVMQAQGPVVKARWADCTARSTSSAVACGMRHQTWPVVGLTLSNILPSDAPTHAPSISIW